MEDSNRRYQLTALDRQGLMLGLTMGQLVVLSVGLMAAVFALSTALPLAAAVAPLVVAGLIVKGRILGVPLMDWIPAVRNWRANRSSREWQTNEPWDGVSGEAPSVLAGLQVSEEAWTGPQKLAVLWDSSDESAAMFLRVPGADFALRDESEKSALLDGWGVALSAHAMAGSPVDRICWSEISNRTSLDDHETWVRSRGTDVNPEMRKLYESIVRTAGPETTSHEVVVAVVVTARRLRASRWGSAGKSEQERLLDGLRRAGHSLLRGLDSAGLSNAQVLGRNDLALVMREACDPSVATAVAPRSGSLSEQLGIVGGDRMGPNQTYWSSDWFETDLCAHRSWWVQDWPRQPVAGPWLSDLLSVPDSARRFTVIFRPVAPESSHKRIEKEFTRLDADMLSREESGRRTNAEARRTRESVEVREEELVSGFAEVEYCGLVTVSSTSMSGLELAASEFESSAVQSGLALRPLDLMHDLGWAASLPLGLGLKSSLAEAI